ncbi:MAG TPA: putative metal-binding motif-containing protein [Myxococcota bacterium]|nr:putative metal-binding motif-containing protein [Myxococcota bacterium]
MRNLLLLLAACNNDAGLKVYNSDPEVSFTQPTNGATFASGAAIQFVASIHDDQTALEDLRLVWSLKDGSTLVGTETRTADGVAMVLESGLPSGEHTVTLVAVDSQSATGEDSVDISVVKNQPPTGEFLNPVENQLVAMELPLRVELQVTDADEPDLAAVGLSWSGLAAGVAEAPAFADSSGKAVFYIGELPAGYQQISVQVTDSLGAVGNSVVSFEVRAGDTDGDGHTGRPFGGDDCDDDDATVYTGAPEHCDGRDEDCDGAVDEDAVDAAVWHPDLDQDNFGDGSQVVAACTQPAGHLSDATDCDDGDVAVNPSATEVCDAVDNNCDGQVDESGSVGETFWYADSDADSFGDPSTLLSACAAPSGYLGDATDCDDGLATVYPGAPEHCDGVDEDCDGRADNAAVDALSWYPDRDGDGFGDASQPSVSCTTLAGHVGDATDCDDGLATVNPAAPEHCDGVDEDCDGQIDDAAVDAPTWYLDADADGYGGTSSSVVDCTLPQGYATTNTDCDDGDAAYHPNAPESSCTDPNDYNCDGSAGYADQDADGYAACEECDDGDATISPDGVEVCNGQDDDCNGTVDDAAADALPWYVDVDGDDHGTGAAVYACSAPVGHVELADD